MQQEQAGQAAAPSFVLVHGAWHGGWCWRHVAARLGAAGYRVFAPTLTGLGERAHLAHKDIDLDTHVADVLGLIEAEELSNVVLCGHSYGGMVVTCVADRVPDRIGALVYLDAFIPGPGESMAALQGAERAATMRKTAAGKGDGWLLPPLPSSYFRVARPEDAAWIDRRCTPQPLGTFEQKASLTGAWEGIAKRAYIRAGGHRSGPFTRYSEMTRDDPGWEHYELPCGHEVMIDMPDALSGILVEIAARMGA